MPSGQLFVLQQVRGRLGRQREKDRQRLENSVAGGPFKPAFGLSGALEPPARAPSVILSERERCERESKNPCLSSADYRWRHPDFGLSGHASPSPLCHSERARTM